MTKFAFGEAASNAIRYFAKSLGDSSINRRIFVGIMTIGSLTLVVQLVAMAKELVVAAWFGTSDAMDAFLMAMVIPTFIINTIAGSFHSALIPEYIRVRDQEGPVTAQNIVSSAMVYCIILILIIIVLVALAAPLILPVVVSGFPEGKLVLTKNLFYWLLPIILIQTLMINWSAVMNADRRFAIAAIAPSALPMSVMIILVLEGEQWGIFSLVAGTLIGFVAGAVVIGLALRRQGFKLRPKLGGNNPNLRKMMTQFVQIVAGVFLMSSASLVDQAMAATLQAGSVAVLNYGSKFVSMGLGLTAASVGTAAFPYFSRQVAQKDWLSLSQTLRFYLRWLFIIAVPVMLFVFVFSEPIIRLLYQRGAFSTQDTHFVAQVQSLFVLQIPFYIGGILLIRVISSLQSNQILMWISGFNLIVKIILNYVFVRWIGVAGIALSTSLMYLGSFVFIYCFVRLTLNKCKKEDTPVDGSRKNLGLFSK